ncbi:hypothetical protein [Embleya sp. NPDC020630]|uniref:hypothetical protein n=1 Tax=Embleya sp. NPDC020630 TaxID=3363979 RepID=UPI0037A20181
MWNRIRGWARVLVVLALLGAGTTQCARGPGGRPVVAFPYLAAGTRNTHPVTKEPLDLGGSRAANAAAQERGWPQVLALLASLTR